VFERRLCFDRVVGVTGIFERISFLLQKSHFVFHDHRISFCGIYWGEFRVGKLFKIHKPQVYHTYEVKEDFNGIPYVVRSKFNNGIKCRVHKNFGIVASPGGVISFGSENASFFYQAEEWCSGRDIYYIDTRGIPIKSCLFLITCLQTIVGRYSYNNGLFPELLKKEIIKLPINAKGDPDWVYMENYMRSLECKQKILGCFRTIGLAQ